MDDSLRPRYTIYVCPECGEQVQYAGFCDSPGHRRAAAFSVIPVEKIVLARDEFVATSSPLPAMFVEQFVEWLLQGRSSESHDG